MYEYEPLRDYYIHRIIYYMLNLEFSISYYVAENIVIEHFPMHEFNKKETIRRYWGN